MTKYLKKKWIKALRSGDYAQTNGFLKHSGRYCCLGVLCEISSKLPFARGHVFPYGDFFFNDIEIPPCGLNKIGLTFEEHTSLANLNDDDESFDTIADWIKVNIN